MVNWLKVWVSNGVVFVFLLWGGSWLYKSRFLGGCTLTLPASSSFSFLCSLSLSLYISFSCFLAVCWIERKLLSREEPEKVAMTVSKKWVFTSLAVLFLFLVGAMATVRTDNGSRYFSLQLQFSSSISTFFSVLF